MLTETCWLVGCGAATAQTTPTAVTICLFIGDRVLHTGIAVTDSLMHDSRLFGLHALRDSINGPYMAKLGYNINKLASGIRDKKEVVNCYSR